MKQIIKNLLLISCICICLFLTGCSNNIQVTNQQGNIETTIKIDKKYTLKDYKKEYTKDGCIVTVYYELK